MIFFSEGLIITDMIYKKACVMNPFEFELRGGYLRLLIHSLAVGTVGMGFSGVLVQTRGY